MSSAAMSSECTRVVCACPSPSLDVCMSACVWCVRARDVRAACLCAVCMHESLCVRGASTEYNVCVAVQFPCGAWRLCSRHGSPRSSRRAPRSAAKAIKLCSRSVDSSQRWRRGRLQRFGRGGNGAQLLGLRFGLGSAAAALLALIDRCATLCGARRVARVRSCAWSARVTEVRDREVTVVGSNHVCMCVAALCYSINPSRACDLCRLL